MVEHPTIPMHNSLHRSQVIGKASTSYAKVPLYLYADSSSDTSAWDPATANYEFQVFEIDNNTASGSGGRNWVRTVVDYTEAVDQSSYAMAEDPGELITSPMMNLNTDADVYYAIRATYDNNFMSGVSYGVFFEGNGYTISQAADYTDFESSAELDAEHPDAQGQVTLGSGFPSARYINGIISSGWGYTFRVNHDGSTGDPIWIPLNIT